MNESWWDVGAAGQATEHYEARVGGRDEVTRVSLRVTTILRPEGDTWRIVHRHADPITSSRSPDTVLGKP